MSERTVGLRYSIDSRERLPHARDDLARRVVLRSTYVKTARYGCTYTLGIPDSTLPKRLSLFLAGIPNDPTSGHRNSELARRRRSAHTNACEMSVGAFSTRRRLSYPRLLRPHAEASSFACLADSHTS